MTKINIDWEQVETVAKRANAVGTIAQTGAAIIQLGVAANILIKVTGVDDMLKNKRAAKKQERASKKEAKRAEKQANKDCKKHVKHEFDNDNEEDTIDI